jgi:hypothetical protein
MPVEPLPKFVKLPTGTTGVSKLPFTIRFACAEVAPRQKSVTMVRVTRKGFIGILLFKMA